MNFDMDAVDDETGTKGVISKDKRQVVLKTPRAFRKPDIGACGHRVTSGDRKHRPLVHCRRKWSSDSELGIREVRSPFRECSIIEERYFGFIKDMRIDDVGVGQRRYFELNKGISRSGARGDVA